MKYCTECGHPLTKRILEHEGETPYCESCHAFRFPIFSTAISMIVLNPKQDKILLIQQYQKPANILVAGYVNKGESLEEALHRECMEEIGRKITAHQYLRSEYFEKTNTIVCNFVVVLDDDSLTHVSDWEVDHAAWYSFTEAKSAIKPDSLAERFLLNFFRRLDAGYILLDEVA